MSDVLLETRNLVIKFGGVTAADNVSLKIHAGRNMAIIGPNGAGKTTFLNICTGWIKPTQGQVLFEGRDITPLPPRKIVQRGVARAFQIPQLFTEHTALENLLISAAARGADRRHMMMIFSVLLIVSNLMVAFAEGVYMLLAGRVLLGIALGGFWAMSTAVTMRLVPPGLVPRALSILMSGVSAATVFAAPVGSYLGEIIVKKGGVT